MVEKEKNRDVIYAYDELSAEELHSRLNLAFFCTEDFTDEALEEVDKLVAAYQEKVPHGPVKTTEESWEEFKTIYLASYKENSETTLYGQFNPSRSDSRKRSHKKLSIARIGVIAAVIVALLIGATVTANAFGFNLWSWVINSNDEVVQFNMDGHKERNTHSINTALDLLATDEAIYPTWLPEGFTLSESQISLNEPFLLYEAYRANDLFFSISIRQSSPAIESTDFQKDSAPYTEYYVNNIVHYLFSDSNDYSIAIWNTDNYTVTISGNISMETLKRIIDSVYEVQS